MADNKKINFPTENCETCPAFSQLEQMGIKTGDFDRVIALAGNPNTGKSTLFNALTGLNQHTGNWPGKTVSRAEGGYQFNNIKYKLVDLPGTYSLLSSSQDEEVARNFLLFGQPDCTIVVADATALERNLNLTIQVMEVTTKVVLAVNLMDEAKRKGIDVDTRALSRHLGIPAIPITARTGEGISTLLRTVADVIENNVKTSPLKIDGTPEFQKAVDDLIPIIQEYAPNIPNPRWVAIRMLDGDLQVQQALLNKEMGSLVSEQSRMVDKFSSKMSVDGRQ